MPFGRTELSIGGIGTTFHVLLHRHGPVGPTFRGMLETFDCHDLCSYLVLVYFGFVLWFVDFV